MEGFVMTKQKIFLGLAVLFGAALAVIVHITQVKADGNGVSITSVKKDKGCAAGYDVCKVTKTVVVIKGKDGKLKRIVKETVQTGRPLK